MAGHGVRMDVDRWETAEAFGRVWGVSVGEVIRRAVDLLEQNALDHPLPDEPPGTQQCPQSRNFPHPVEPDGPVEVGQPTRCMAVVDGTYCGATFTWGLFQAMTEQKKMIKAESVAGPSKHGA